MLEFTQFHDSLTIFENQLARVESFLGNFQTGAGVSDHAPVPKFLGNCPTGAGKNIEQKYRFLARKKSNVLGLKKNNV